MSSTAEAWRDAVVVKPFNSWMDACNDDEFKCEMANRMIVMGTNLDGGSVSFVNNKLGRAITHIAIAPMSDHNSVIQMIGRAFHNQPDVKVMLKTRGTSMEDGQKYIFGKPIVRAFMSAYDIEELKRNFDTTDEMCANYKTFNTIDGANALYSMPINTFLKHNTVGLAVAKVSQKVRQFTAIATAEEAKAKWGDELCPEHVKELAVVEETQRVAKAAAAANCFPSLIIGSNTYTAEVLQIESKDMRADTCTVVCFRGMDSVEMVNFNVDNCIVKTTVDQPDGGVAGGFGCPAHIAPEEYGHTWFYNTDKHWVEMRVMTVPADDEIYQKPSFTWIEYEGDGRWSIRNHVRDEFDGMGNDPRVRDLVQRWWGANTLIGKIFAYVHQHVHGVDEQSLKAFVESCGSINVDTMVWNLTRKEKPEALVFEKSGGVYKIRGRALQYIPV